MGKTSSAVKRKYNAKAYDSITFNVPKGGKDELKAFAAKQEESMAGLLWRLVQQEMKNVENNADD